MTALVFPGLLACVGARAPASCDALAGVERDQCLMDRVAVQDAAHAANVITQARKIRDPMIRGAAVSAWVAHHDTGVSPGDGQTLCGLLAGQDHALCPRRLSSPHLQR